MSPISARIKNVHVIFDDSLNTSFFDQSEFNNIKSNGLFLTDYNLMHYASIHYQSRYQNNIPKRIRYTLDTLEPTLINSKNDRFYFSDIEESELQKQSSEVIGVGFAVALSHKLFNVNLNRINRIISNGKRCDFKIINKNGKIILESKGGKQSLSTFKSRISDQKQSYQGLPSFGIISRILRNHIPVSINVVDPDANIIDFDETELITNILIHYSKAARLSGFYRLSEKLNGRIYDIKSGEGNLINYNNLPLDYENIFKIGKTMEISIGESFKAEAFFSPNLDNGLKHKLNDGSLLFFAIDKKLIGILNEQNYEKLISYHLNPHKIKNACCFYSG